MPTGVSTSISCSSFSMTWNYPKLSNVVALDRPLRTLAGPLRRCPCTEVKTLLPSSESSAIVIQFCVLVVQCYPETQVSAALLDSVVNLLEEGGGCGATYRRVARFKYECGRVGSFRTLVCVSPDYLKANSTSKSSE